MLTLSRKIGESIFITNGDVEIEVNISNIRRYKAEISINAPDDFEILREELLEIPGSDDSSH